MFSRSSGTGFLALASLILASTAITVGQAPGPNRFPGDNAGDDASARR